MKFFLVVCSCRTKLLPYVAVGICTISGHLLYLVLKYATVMLI